MYMLGWSTREPDRATVRRTCLFYDGQVTHSRTAPARHKFRYNVRYAFLNLDEPPLWFHQVQKEYLSSKEARELAGLKEQGPTWLLTLPPSAGYSQNPISVYYCYDVNRTIATQHNEAFTPGILKRCVAEVTNTPWGERVVFSFCPESDTVPKALHVSPFMDMQGIWHLKAPPPGDQLSLTVSVTHPLHGKFFTAHLSATWCKEVRSNDVRWCWLMAHRVAIGIYWQALLLLRKGVPFISHPKDVDPSGSTAYRREAHEKFDQMRGQEGLCSACPVTLGYRNQVDQASTNTGHCFWREAAGYPWK
ncbi:hypothetical protein CYMTET_39820 [Cymbomonas tetramitiformis]|uniref:Uncharacterized protein n=1 Tax=Cymbomonas tetramitiformis TaxID=36881 RepID=A0AAE0F450_9CHLO|nr:hypothetical protein CYMTET_39820 [Cymbomonas tetramitiformis]